MGCIVTKRTVTIRNSAIISKNQQHSTTLPEKDSIITSLDDYITIKLLGRGKSCEVLLSLFRPSSKYRALKILPKSQESRYLIQEFHLLQTLTHPSILTLYDLLEDHHNYYISSQYCAGGDLTKLLNSLKYIPEASIAFIMLQVFEALAYCHSKKVVHRDLKLENILLLESEKFLIKVADFGYSCLMDKEKARGVCGTLSYMAPEIELGPYDQKVDIWSAGVVMFILGTGKMPFGRRRESFDLDKGVGVLGRSPEFDNIVKQMLHVSPDLRPSAEELLRNDWFKIFDFDEFRQ